MVEPLAESPSGSRRSTERVHDDAARLDRASIEEGAEGQRRSRRVAARRRDQRRANELLTMSFDQSVHRTSEQLRCAVGLAVPGRVLLSTLEAEVRAEVHHLHTPLEQIGNEVLTLPVRKRQKGNLDRFGQ